MNEVLDIIKRSPEGCTAKDMKDIRQIISTNDINMQDSEGRTTLLLLCCSDYYNGGPFAPQCSCIEIIKILLEYKANVNVQDNLGNTALGHCCNKWEGYEIAKLLLMKENNANVNIQDSVGLTPLMVVSWYSHDYDVEFAKLLLMKENNANVNIQNNKGKTALMYVIKNTDLDFRDHSLKILQLLLENGANTNMQDNKGKTALMRITDNCSYKMKAVKLLLEYDAKPYSTQDINIFVDNIAKLNVLS